MNWVKNRWIDALLKYLAIYAVYHIVFIFVGLILGTNKGMFANLLWSHLSNVTFFNYLTVIFASVIFYFLIYLFLCRDDKENLTGKM